MEEDIIKAREEGIRMGAELAAMHGSDATSQELEKAFFDGCEVGYKKASEELQPYIDLYKDLAENAEKTAREVIDKYPKWIPVTERLPELHEEVLVCNEEYGRSELGFAMVAVWDGTDWIETWNRSEAIHCVTHWMPLPQLPEPPKEECGWEFI